MIKAIETEWKGYRFRSRLEARWAVFFEHMGWTWEYEPQGFETTYGRYLPDFYVHDTNTWFEIKPENTPLAVSNVYLAGKVGKNCWRHSLASGLKRSYDCLGPWDWSLSRCGIDGRIMKMTGPFFRSCDHGCGHGNGTHGQGAAPCFEGMPFDSYETYGACMKAIAESDVFFAWIDALDCYGTLIEAGYAKGIGKKVVVGFSEDVFEKSMVTVQEDISGGHGAFVAEQKSDLWFLMQAAEKHGVFKNAKEAFTSLVPPSAEEKSVLKIKEVADTQSGFWAFCAGDPMAGKRVCNCRDFPDRWRSAAAAARSARFEHGEKPGAF